MREEKGYVEEKENEGMGWRDKWKEEGEKEKMENEKKREESKI